MNDFKICPICGSKKIRNIKMRKWFCENCGFDLYNNVATAVGLIISDKDGKIIFERRNKNPKKGFLAFPGGFVDPDETAEEACFRECKEELGVQIKNLCYVGSFPNTYEYKNIQYKTCDLFFEAEIDADSDFSIQQSEVECLEKVSIKSEKDIENTPLAFKSAQNILKLWLKNKSN